MYKVTCECNEEFMRVSVQAGLHFEANAHTLTIEYTGGY